MITTSALVLLAVFAMDACAQGPSGEEPRRRPEVSVETEEPRAYTEESLRAAIREKVGEEDARLAVLPYAGGPEIDRWAKRITEGAGDEMEKARSIFRAILARPPQEGRGGNRTALEALSVWDRPGEALNCQEYAKLFVALARAAGLRSYFVHLERDLRGTPVVHDCAAVFAGGKAYLVDPVYRRFGIAHREFAVLDDLQAIAHHLAQAGDPSTFAGRARIAARLDSTSAWVRIALAFALVGDGRWDEARAPATEAARLGPGRWDTTLLQGLLAFHDGRLDEAARSLRRSIEAHPRASQTHQALAEVLRAQGKARDALEEYRASLRNEPLPAAAEKARKAIGEIEASLGRSPGAPGR